MWIEILWIALPLVPYLLSAVLLSARRLEALAAGAGIAAGLFGYFLVVSPFIYMGLVLAYGLAQLPYFLQTAISVLVLFLISLLIVVSAVRIGKTHWGAFLSATVATITCVAYGQESLKSAEGTLEREYQRRRIEAESPPFYRPVAAQQNIISFASCLLLNHSVHPEAGYPPSLNPPPSNWSCETKFATNAVKEYTLSYVPQLDSTTRRPTAFRLTAIPVRKGGQYLRGSDFRSSRSDVGA